MLEKCLKLSVTMSSSITNDFPYVFITLNTTAIKKSAVSCIMNKTEKCYPDLGLKFNINEINRTHYNRTL